MDKALPLIHGEKYVGELKIINVMDRALNFADGKVSKGLWENGEFKGKK